MILDQRSVEHYLSAARSLGRAQPLYDVHVSPYEVIFCEFDYRPDRERAGVHSLGRRSYQPPSPGPLRIEDAAASDQIARRPEVPRALSLMICRKHYAHIGPRVLADQMALSGISRSLLIPVLRQDSDRAEQRRLMFDIYRDDERFGFAYCPPRPADAAEAVADIRRVGARHRLRALKVNPNIQGIDLSSRSGRERLEYLLEAGRVTGLPMIVHGGISRLLKDPRCRAYAALDNLLSVPWRRAKVPVVLSHAGMFGCPADAIDELLPKLSRLLADHDNLLIDISGLAMPTLCAVLARVDSDRIVFGSDALYFPQWSAVVRLLFALGQLGMPVEETFVKLAGTNPASRVFGREPW